MDIVAIETAKAKEQALRLFGRGITDSVEEVVTALLEAKADVLEAYAAHTGETVGYSDFRPHYEALRQEVRNRKAHGL